MYLSLLQGIAAGIILGTSIAAPPGPVSAVMAHQVTSRKSWRSGYLVGLGATTSDAIFLVITFLGWTGIVARNPTLTFWIYLVGACILILYAMLMIFRRKQKGSSTNESKVDQRWPYFVGLSIGLTNPFQIAWWLSVGIASISSFGDYVVFGFFAGILIWISFYTTALKYGVLRFKGFEKLVLILSAIVLLGFAAWFLYGALHFY